MEKETFIVKIYLKSQKRPIKLIVEKKTLVDEMFDKLEKTEDPIVKFGNFMFLKEDFLCAIYNVKIKKF